jgi:hypothetical protein
LIIYGNEKYDFSESKKYFFLLIIAKIPMYMEGFVEEAAGNVEALLTGILRSKNRTSERNNNNDDRSSMLQGRNQIVP